MWNMCDSISFYVMQVLQNKVLKVIYRYERHTHGRSKHELGAWRLSRMLQFEQSKLISKLINEQQK